MKALKYIIIGTVLLCATLSAWHWYAENHLLPEVVDTKEELEGEIIFCPPPPQIVICEEAPKLTYPEHWGPPPNIQLRDYVKLPEPYGHGSSTLKHWIEKNQKEDANPISLRPPGEPTPTLEESFNIPDTVPNRVVIPK